MIDELNFGDEIRRYTKHWKWFVISVILGIVVAHLVIRYSTPKFLAQAKIQIVQEQGSGSGMNLLQDLGVYSEMENNIEDEIPITCGPPSNLISGCPES